MANQFNFFRGMVGPRVVGTGGALLNEPYIPLQITHAPPEGMSYRHWNILPQDLRGGERENMELYIEGWEAPRRKLSKEVDSGVENGDQGVRL